MKDGDVSLILKKVAFNDTGMYECHVAVRNPVSSKRAHTEISHFINLTVTGETDKTLLEQQLKEKGATDMYDRKAETLSIQIVVVVVLIAAAIGFMVFLRFKRSKEQFPAKPSDKREEMA